MPALRFINIILFKVNINGGYLGNNIGSYISNLALKAINTFINNTAFSGGGISLRAPSLLNLAAKVQITFINNTAVTYYGGVVYSEFMEVMNLLGVINGCFWGGGHFLETNFTFINNSAFYREIQCIRIVCMAVIQLFKCFHFKQ